MSFDTLHEEMNGQIAGRQLFAYASQAAGDYLDGARDMDAFPSAESFATRAPQNYLEGVIQSTNVVVRAQARVPNCRSAGGPP